ncbi:MAG TPA: hypothetical protein VK510_04450 [Solirubrobacteraceae bacterium]|nr:hypothetical protein [Solirubrobacteraceae bacterium]
MDVAQGQRGALARRQAVEQRECAGQLVIVARWRVVTRALGLASPARARSPPRLPAGLRAGQ